MTATLTAAEGRALLANPKRSKYRNRKVVVDGFTYDSEAEADYCERLKLREKAGEISGLELQRPFAIPAPNGEVITVYKADAVFWDHVADRFRVIDVKGVETPVFKLKRKLMRLLLGVEVEVVRVGKSRSAGMRARGAFSKPNNSQ